MPCKDSCNFFSQHTPLKRQADFHFAQEAQHLTGYADCLILTGPKYNQHIQDAFLTYHAKTVTIIERDLQTIAKLFKTAKKCTYFKQHRVFINHGKAEDAGYRGKEYIYLDFMQTPLATGLTLKRALMEQIVSTGKRNKVFKFTMATRNYGYEKCFQFLNELLSMVGCNLSGFNGVVGSFGGVGNTIPSNKQHLLYKEFEADFIEKGRVRKILCATYRDKDHAQMVTTSIMYK
jgi:hypothetical protein